MRGAVVRQINSLGRVPDREVLESADEDRRNVLRVPGDSIDSSRVTSGTIGDWDISVSEFGKRAGIFARKGIDLDISYSAGSASAHSRVT